MRNAAGGGGEEGGRTGDAMRGGEMLYVHAERRADIRIYGPYYRLLVHTCRVL